MTAHSEETVEDFIHDLEQHGYSKIDAIKKVRAEYDITFTWARDLIDRFWDMASTDSGKVGGW